MGCNSSKAFREKPSTTAKPQSRQSVTRAEKRPNSDEQPLRAAPAAAPASTPARAPVPVPAPPVKRPQERKPVTQGGTNTIPNESPVRIPPVVTRPGGGNGTVYGGGGSGGGGGGGGGGDSGDSGDSGDGGDSGDIGC